MQIFRIKSRDSVTSTTDFIRVLDKVENYPFICAYLATSISANLGSMPKNEVYIEATKEIRPNGWTVEDIINLLVGIDIDCPTTMRRVDYTQTMFIVTEYFKKQSYIFSTEEFIIDAFTPVEKTKPVSNETIPLVPTEHIEE